MVYGEVTAWMRDHLIEHGRSWVINNYDLFKREVDSKMSPETYSREVRRVWKGVKQLQGQPVSDPVQSSDVRTLDDAMTYHDVDETSLRLKRIRYNTWGSATSQNQQVSVELEPRTVGELTLEQAATRFAELTQSYTPPPLPDPVPDAVGDLTYEVSLPDLHIGKVIYREATGKESFDVDDARTIYLDAVDNLIRGLPTGGTVILVVGNDYFNVDTYNKTTTKGTPQPNEHPLRMFDIGLLTTIEAIYRLLTIGPVRVVVVPGNHDRVMSYVYGWALTAWFRTMDTVTVDNGARPEKAYGDGAWGVVWHHGHKLKPADLAMLFADGFPDLWARTRYREVHQGHLHHLRSGELRATDESAGVRVRLLPSLVPADEWHLSHAYRAVREGTLLIWDRSAGLIGQRYYHPHVESPETHENGP
jgi:hypothetical protein